MQNTIKIGIGIAMCAGTIASASVSQINGWDDVPRLFNDRPDSQLTYMSTYDAMGSSVSFTENNYGTGGFANRHASWFSDGMGSRVDMDYADAFDMQMTMQINEASSVDNVEAGFQFDLFGFGLFGVLAGSGEVAAFGSVLPFHSFGAGVYNVGDEIMLRMVHTPGAGEFSGTNSTMEYMYNNLTTGSGWVSSGAIDFTTLEGGIPDAFSAFAGVGAQINNPDPVDGAVSIDFSNITASIPSPGALALLGLAGVGAARRRR